MMLGSAGRRNPTLISREIITSAEEGGYVFTSVCLSVYRITEKVVNGF